MEGGNRQPVTPPLKEEAGNKSASSGIPVNSTEKVSEDLKGLKYASIEDFIVKLEPIPKLWKSKNKIITVKPITKGERDAALAPINSQKIEAQADGSTKGFYISLELFDKIKEVITVASLSHYTGADGKPVINNETVKKLDTTSYDELCNICLEVNKIDFFEAQASDVGGAIEAKN